MLDHKLESPSEDKEGQFIYCNRWVDKKHFRAYVYSKDAKKIANSYDEYLELIATGLWFDNPPQTEVKNATTKSKRSRIRK